MQRFDTWNHEGGRPINPRIEGHQRRALGAASNGFGGTETPQNRLSGNLEGAPWSLRLRAYSKSTAPRKSETAKTQKGTCRRLLDMVAAGMPRRSTEVRKKGGEKVVLESLS